jgi:putative nucleotidyltransferase with HDIG domain
VAKQTLMKLVEDGRIHPSRIEETYYQSKAEIEELIVQMGQQAIFEANIGTMHEELAKLLGRLRYRTSYGQNILRHSLECAHLAGIMAAELGASVKTAKRAALLHDVGKAMTHEVEGSHAIISAQQAKKYGEILGLPAEQMKGVTADFRVAMTDDAEKNKEALAKALGSYGDALVNSFKDQIAPLQQIWTRQAAEAYLTAVGQVAFAWNSLHEKLGELFVAIVQAQNNKVCGFR